jgi:16S rRNA (uracil1498-N3)-methyltransferase
MVPRISPLTAFPQLLVQTADTELKLFCWEEEKKENLRQALEVKSRVRQACVLIGPEGGFSAKEAEEAASAGFQGISLGRRILRTETAAIVVVGLIQYALGDLGH